MNSRRDEQVIIGRCIGEVTPTYVSFVSKTIPATGDYVLIEFDDNEVLGLITTLRRGNPAITEEIYDPQTISKIKHFEGEDFYIHGIIRILGDIDKLEIPRSPPPPGTAIKPAPQAVLEKIFQSQNENCITIGSLISNEAVPVAVNVNKMVSRHLAILAITGAGKSNAVAVIIDQLLTLNGCIVVFDMHSEYSNATFTNGEINHIPANLNPRYLSLGEFFTLLNIYGSAYVQQRYVRKAYYEVKDQIRFQGLTTTFLKALTNKLEEYLANDDYSSDRSSIVAALSKVEDLSVKYRSILDSSFTHILAALEPGEVNVIDLGSIDEEMIDVIVSHVLKSLLNNRKRHKQQQTGGFPHPTFIVLEEAHVLAPTDRSPLSKHWIARIAREGRKFGLGFCLVSQRPKVLDPNALSQANNMIILKLVEPGDQRHVQQASETLSDDLITQLPSLNTGEAILLGMMTKVPALVKITEFAGSFVSQDIDVVKVWRETEKQQTKKLKQQQSDLQDIYGGDW